MRRRAAAGSKTAKKRPRGKAKPRVAQAARKSAEPAANLQEQLDQALEREAATAEVLRVISRSPGSLGPVFQAILEKATRICDAKFGTMYLYEQSKFRPAAFASPTPEFERFLTERGAFVPSPGQPLGCLLKTKKIVHTFGDSNDGTSIAAFKFGGARTHMAVPMLKDSKVIGAIMIFRQEERLFTDKQIKLVQNFAAQAVIAIENTRLLNELRESLQQQTATSEVLQVISSSPGELEPIFNTMIENATQLCRAEVGTLALCEGGGFRGVAVYGHSARYADVISKLHRPPPQTALGQLEQTRQTIQVTDIAGEPAYDGIRRLNPDFRRVRTGLFVPIVKERNLVGAFLIYRHVVRPFTDKQIELVQNFAAQAVIAIENSRLLNELRQRTDDLTESLEQQTATSEVLKVISSSPGELESVFQVMLENATRICEAKFANLWLREGSGFRAAAMYNAPAAWAEERRRTPVVQPVGPRHILRRVAETKQVNHVLDVLEEEGSTTSLARTRWRPDDHLGANA